MKKKALSTKSVVIKKKPAAPTKRANVKKAATLVKNKKELPVKVTNVKKQDSSKSNEVSKGNASTYYSNELCVLDILTLIPFNYRQKT